MRTRKMLMACLLLITLLGFRDASHRSVRRRWYHGAPEGDVYILVIKSNYELQLYDKDGWYATYPAVFGNKSLDDKMMQGDRKTPEGTYHIISKRPHEKWDKIMDLDYPTAPDIEKFIETKSKAYFPRTPR